MKDAMNNFENAVNELMDSCKAMIGREMFDGDIDEPTFNLVRQAFKIVDTAMEVTKKQTEMMIEMNEKLDKLTM